MGEKAKKKKTKGFHLKATISVLLASSCIAVCGCAGVPAGNEKDTAAESTETTPSSSAQKTETATTENKEKDTAESGKEREEMVRVGDVQLSVKEAGTGPDLILIHGRTLSKESMDTIFNYYKENYHVISYDVRGHGETISPGGRCTMDDLSDDLVGLIKEKNLYKPAIIGFSMGSYIGLRTAERYPDLLSGLVLIGTRGKGNVNTYFEDDEVSYAMDTFDNMTDAAKVDIRALVISGEYDNINPAEEGRKVADILPDSEFLIVPDVGHSAHTWNLSLFCWKTDTFLKELKRR